MGKATRQSKRKYLSEQSKKSILAGEAYKKEASSLGLNLREV